MKLEQAKVKKVWKLIKFNKNAQRLVMRTRKI